MASWKWGLHWHKYAAYLRFNCSCPILYRRMISNHNIINTVRAETAPQSLKQRTLSVQPINGSRIVDEFALPFTLVALQTEQARQVKEYMSYSTKYS